MREYKHLVSLVLYASFCTATASGQSVLESAARRIQNADAAGAAKLLTGHLKQSPRDAAAWNLLGIAETELGRADAADGAFERGLAIQPDSGLLHENHGLSLYRRGDFHRARTKLDAAVRAGVTKPEVLFQLAVSRLRTGQMTQGLQELRSLEQQLASAPQYWEERGIAESGSDLAAAAASLDRAMALDPKSVRSLAAAASVAERGKDTEKALALLLRARALAPSHAPILVQFGRICLQRDLGQDAIEALDRACQLEPDNREAQYLLAAAHITVEKYQRAHQLLTAFLKTEPNHATAHYSLGWLELKLNRPHAARPQFERALALAPGFAAALLELADLDLQSGEIDRSEQRIRQAIERNPQSARAHVIQGDIWNQREDFEKAQAAYRQAIRVDKTFAAAHSRLARILFRKRDIEGGNREQKLAAELNETAKKESRRAFSLAGMDAASPSLFRFETGRALYQAEQYEAALKQLDASEQVGEAAPLRTLYRGMCLAQLGRWQEALNLLKDASQPEAWYWIGASQYYTKDFDGARRTLDRAIEFRPQDADAYRMRGLVSLQQNRWDEGYRDWVQAVRLNPRDTKTLYYLGRLFQEAGQIDQAKLWLTDAVAASANHYEALTYLGLCEESLGNSGAASSLFKRAIEASVAQKKPYAWAFLSLGKLHRRENRIESARQVLEEGARLDPEPHLLHELAKLLLTLKETAGAESLLRQALAKDSSIPEVHYQLGRLLAAKGNRDEADSYMESFRKAKEAEARKPRVKIMAQ